MAKAEFGKTRAAILAAFALNELPDAAREALLAEELVASAARRDDLVLR